MITEQITEKNYTIYIYIHYIQKGQDLSHDKSRSYYTFAYISSKSEGPKRGFACIKT